MKAILLNWFEFKYELITKKNLISLHGREVALLPVLYITLKFAFALFTEMNGWCKIKYWNKTPYLMFYNFIEILFCLVQFMSVIRFRRYQEKRIWLSSVTYRVIISVTVTL